METPPSHDYFQSGFYYRHGAQQLTPEKWLSTDLKQEPFAVEEFLDFSNDEENAMVVADVKPLSAFDVEFHNAGGGLNSAEPSSVTLVDSCNSRVLGERSHVDGSFAGGELCVPYEDVAELEWLSTITEESFSSEDMQKLQLISGMTTADRFNDPGLTEPIKPDASIRAEISIPGKTRSKRSRAAPGNWASRLQVMSPTSSASETDHQPIVGEKSVKAMTKKEDSSDRDSSSNGRRCLHCATEKTPHWRTGPMGPKTLCNACGVRYKSGRLVPEYRPAASPTFVQTKHSNSHRKVLELRRQKDILRPQPSLLHHHLHPHNLHQRGYLQHQQSMIFDDSNGEEYSIHQHLGPDFRQLI